MNSTDIEINKRKILSEYNFAKQKGNYLLNKKKFEKAIAFYHLASTIAWKYPILFNYSDDQIESSLSDFTKNNFTRIIGGTDKKRIVFYNGQIVDRGGLTEQYLNYFIENNFQILFIISCKKKTYRGKNILKIASINKNVEVLIPKQRKKIDKITFLRKKIESFNPCQAFLHFLPNDVIGFCTFSNTNNLVKNFIVHNDHTFWLGKKCSDRFIEFREYGISLSTQRRKLDKNKLLHLPYYPIIEKNKFRGFPFDRSNKIIGISAGSVYKYISDQNLEYFNVIRDLLFSNPNFIFCLCTYGSSKKIEDFILKNNLENRFFLLGSRSDFYDLVGNCDIMFESFPIKGGLTPLFAIEQDIPVIGISCSNNSSGSLEGLLQIKNYSQPKSMSEFKEQAFKLIKSKKERTSLSKVLKNNRLRKIFFDEELSNILNNNPKNSIVKKVKNLYLDDNKELLNYLNLNSKLLIDLETTKIKLLKLNLSIFRALYILFKLFKLKLITYIENYIKILKKRK